MQGFVLIMEATNPPGYHPSSLTYYICIDHYNMGMNKRDQESINYDYKYKSLNARWFTKVNKLLCPRLVILLNGMSLLNYKRRMVHDLEQISFTCFGSLEYMTNITTNDFYACPGNIGLRCLQKNVAWPFNWLSLMRYTGNIGMSHQDMRGTIEAKCVSWLTPHLFWKSGESLASLTNFTRVT